MSCRTEQVDSMQRYRVSKMTALYSEDNGLSVVYIV